MEALQDEVTMADVAAFRHKAGDYERVAVLGGIIEKIEVHLEVHETKNDYGTFVFDVRGIKDALADGVIPYVMVRATLDDDFVSRCRNNNGVDPLRAARLTADDLARPGIAVHWPNGYTTLIDGNHRLCQLWDTGGREFRFAVITIGPSTQPYICKPGDEGFFMDRRYPDTDRVVLSRSCKRVER